jgi:hypothetical protein
MKTVKTSIEVHKPKWSTTEMALSSHSAPALVYEVLNSWHNA